MNHTISSLVCLLVAVVCAFSLEVDSPHANIRSPSSSSGAAASSSSLSSSSSFVSYYGVSVPHSPFTSQRSYCFKLSPESIAFMQSLQSIENKNKKTCCACRFETAAKIITIRPTFTNTNNANVNVNVNVKIDTDITASYIERSILNQLGVGSFEDDDDDVHAPFINSCNISISLIHDPYITHWSLPLYLLHAFDTYTDAECSRPLLVHLADRESVQAGYPTSYTKKINSAIRRRDEVKAEYEHKHKLTQEMNNIDTDDSSESIFEFEHEHEHAVDDDDGDDDDHYFPLFSSPASSLTQAAVPLSSLIHFDTCLSLRKHYGNNDNDNDDNDFDNLIDFTAFYNILPSSSSLNYSFPSLARCRSLIVGYPSSSPFSSLTNVTAVPTKLFNSIKTVGYIRLEVDDKKTRTFVNNARKRAIKSTLQYFNKYGDVKLIDKSVGTPSESGVECVVKLGSSQGRFIGRSHQPYREFLSLRSSNIPMPIPMCGRQRIINNMLEIELSKLASDWSLEYIILSYFSRLIMRVLSFLTEIDIDPATLDYMLEKPVTPTPTPTPSNANINTNTKRQLSYTITTNTRIIPRATSTTTAAAAARIARTGKVEGDVEGSSGVTLRDRAPAPAAPTPAHLSRVAPFIPPSAYIHNVWPLTHTQIAPAIENIEFGSDLLRILHYHKPPSSSITPFLSNLHADVSLLTLAPMSSLPGLVVLHDAAIDDHNNNSNNRVRAARWVSIETLDLARAKAREQARAKKRRKSKSKSKSKSSTPPSTSDVGNEADDDADDNDSGIFYGLIGETFSALSALPISPSMHFVTHYPVKSNHTKSDSKNNQNNDNNNERVSMPFFLRPLPSMPLCDPIRSSYRRAECERRYKHDIHSNSNSKNNNNNNHNDDNAPSSRVTVMSYISDHINFNKFGLMNGAIEKHRLYREQKKGTGKLGAFDY